MQTFLPYSDFEASAKVLDYKRLGKQRVETLQILNCLNGHSSGWINHPAVRMWRGYAESLSNYGYFVVAEWIKRGYNNSMSFVLTPNAILPPWLGSAEFHASHRSNLLRKDPLFYGRYGWLENPNLPYVWPI
jgi:hypothetical protein